MTSAVARDRLWNSSAGEWLARRLGAPERSRAVGGGVFRSTEAALEAFAAEARVELDVVVALAPAGSSGANVLVARREAASLRL